MLAYCKKEKNKGARKVYVNGPFNEKYCGALIEPKMIK
jgi:hypothetical protein